MEDIISNINHKHLEEIIVQAFKAIIKEFLNIEINYDYRDKNKGHDLANIKYLLVRLYKEKLGENIHQSLQGDTTLLIKILSTAYKILF